MSKLQKKIVINTKKVKMHERVLTFSSKCDIMSQNCIF